MMRRCGLLMLGTLALVVALAVPQLAAQQLVAEKARAPSRSMDAAQDGPWPARRRVGVKILDKLEPDATSEGALSPRRLRALGLRGGARTRVSPHRWPKEPGTPDVIDRARFRRAVRQLCPKAVPATTASRIADASLVGAAEFGVDPFVLAAFAHHQSACGSAPPESWGVGATRFNLGMHRGRLHGGAYRYGLPTPSGTFARATLPMKLYPLTLPALRAVEPNLYFAAGLLRVFTEQCPAIDRPFGSAPHRHPISHMVWGDAVRAALPENLILTARRRLLGYYGERTDALQATFEGIEFTSPLDGAPRIASGLMGDPRAHGRRVHAGIDLLAAIGEPVRAMASGRVEFAGVDSRTHGALELAPDRLANVPPDRMGARGLFVRIDHGRDIDTLYVHLSEYVVTTGERVQRGELLGYVGRTGVHTSDAHLHLGLFNGDSVVDPLPHLQPLFLSGDDIPVVDYTTAP